MHFADDQSQIDANYGPASSSDSTVASDQAQIDAILGAPAGSSTATPGSTIVASSAPSSSSTPSSPSSSSSNSSGNVAGDVSSVLSIFRTLTNPMPQTAVVAQPSPLPIILLALVGAGVAVYYFTKKDKKS